MLGAQQLAYSLNPPHIGTLLTPLNKKRICREGGLTIAIISQLAKLILECEPSRLISDALNHPQNHGGMLLGPGIPTVAPPASWNESFLWLGLAGCCRIFRSILGLYTLAVNSRSPFQFMRTPNVSRHRQLPPPGERLLSTKVRYFDY